jgi:hypothetical protein
MAFLGRVDVWGVGKRSYLPCTISVDFNSESCTTIAVWEHLVGRVIVELGESSGEDGEADRDGERGVDDGSGRSGVY